MTPTDVDEIVARLLQGTLPEAQPLELARAARQIASSITSEAGPSAPQIRGALKVLNGARHFEHSKTIGEAWHSRRGIDPTVQKQLAQASIELGAFDEAETLLNDALAAAAASNDLQFNTERPEYRGLLGRIYKQRHVQSEDVNQLVTATDQYLQQYAAKRQYWHGINIVALRTAEERALLDPRPGATVTELARQVLALAVDAQARDGNDHWALATASEACLALHFLDYGPEWCDRGELWLHRFLSHPNTDPFSVESYSRQLREIWRGNPLGGLGCADRFTQIIERHVRRTERRWAVDARRVQEIREHPEVLEKNFSGEKTFTIETLRKMLGLCPSIGCVIDSTGARLGTGFLMAGSTFNLSEPLVFVTNAHVISDEWDGSIKPADAKVTFEVESAAAGAPVAHAVGNVLFTSNPGALGERSPALDNLDVTIVSLKSVPANVAGLKAAANVPLPSPKTKAFVVGHPLSGALQFSLHDSVLLDVCDDERLVHYRTPTDPGSSGSPVFTSRWEVVALHHAGSSTTKRLHGSGEYEANEGVSLNAIRRKLGAA
ncbi:MAG TPA: trypsin-like peptidase domain-containing protein [Thermoanaerobaculia bacterium]